MNNKSQHPSVAPYSALIRAIGQQARELYPKATWGEVSRELESLWISSVTGMGWPEVREKIRCAWEDADPFVDKD